MYSCLRVCSTHPHAVFAHVSVGLAVCTGRADGSRAAQGSGWFVHDRVLLLFKPCLPWERARGYTLQAINPVVSTGWGHVSVCVVCLCVCVRMFVRRTVVQGHGASSLCCSPQIFGNCVTCGACAIYQIGGSELLLRFICARTKIGSSVCINVGWHMC